MEMVAVTQSAAGLSGSLAAVSESRYLLDEATSAKVADAFASGDPVAEIRKHLENLSKAERALAAEKEKWQRVLGAAEVVVGAGELAKRALDRVKLTPLPGEQVERQERLGPAKQNGNGAKPRLAAVLKLMQTDPGRVWKLKELTEGIVELGDVPYSPWLDNQLAKELPDLVRQGAIEKPMKGRYRLPPTANPEGGGRGV